MSAEPAPPSSADPGPGSPAPAASPPLPLRAQLREDRAVHYGSRVHPGYQALAVHRFGRWCRERAGPLGLLGTIAYKAVNNLVIRNIYGTEISVDAWIGRRVLIGHHQAVMIPRHCVIGDDTIIRHSVTIGYASTGAPPEAVPRIGARVDIAPGAHLIGPITIGDDVRIGPGAIVTTDVPAGSTVFAAPARIMRPQPQASQPPPPTPQSPQPAPPPRPPQPGPPQPAQATGTGAGDGARAGADTATTPGSVPPA